MRTAVILVLTCFLSENQALMKDWRKTVGVILVYHCWICYLRIHWSLLFLTWARTRNAFTLYIPVCHVFQKHTSLPVYNDQPNAPLLYVRYNMQTLARYDEWVCFNLMTYYVCFEFRSRAFMCVYPSFLLSVCQFAELVSYTLIYCKVTGFELFLWSLICCSFLQTDFKSLLKQANNSFKVWLWNLQSTNKIKSLYNIGFSILTRSILHW